MKAEKVSVGLEMDEEDPTVEEFDRMFEEGEPVDVVVGPLKPRRLDHIISVRLEPDVAAALRDLANRRRATVSDLIREMALQAIANDWSQRLINFRIDMEQKAWAPGQETVGLREEVRDEG